MESIDEHQKWVTAYKNALLKIEPEINEGQRTMLLGHYRAPDMALSVKRLAEIAGYQGDRAGSLQYGKLARKISEAIGEPAPGDQISMIAQWRGDLKDESGHGQWILYDEVALALEELGWVTKRTSGDETATFNLTKQAFLLTWKDGNPPYKFENFKEIETWRFRSHKQAKVGDEVYLMKQGKPPRGIFGRGVITKTPYQDEDAWVVDIRIDEIVNPSKQLFLPVDDLFQLSPGRGLWYSQSSGIKIPDDVAEAIRRSRQWKPIESPSPTGEITPEKKLTEITRTERDEEVKNWVLKQANGRCECCKQEAPFVLNDGAPYLEVHHVRHLANDGSDTTWNAVAVCPNCHRELHHGKRKEELVESLYASISRLKRE